jgi:hypothetical protein
MHDTDDTRTDAGGASKYGPVFLREVFQDKPNTGEISENGLDLALLNNEGVWEAYMIYRDEIWILTENGDYRASMVVVNDDEQNIVPVDLNEAASILLQESERRPDEGSGEIRLMRDEEFLQKLGDTENPTIEVNEQKHLGHGHKASQGSSGKTNTKSSKSYQTRKEDSKKVEWTDEHEDLGHPPIQDIT